MATDFGSMANSALNSYFTRRRRPQKNGLGTRPRWAIYAEAGYEWIDRAESDLGGMRADVDFSSLVVSAGLSFGF